MRWERGSAARTPASNFCVLRGMKDPAPPIFIESWFEGPCDGGYDCCGADSQASSASGPLRRFINVLATRTLKT